MTSTNPLRSLRAGLGRRLARFVDFRIDDRTRGRLDDHEARIIEQEHCTVDHRRRLDALESGLDRVRGDLLWTTGEVKRLIPHVAAQEVQLEDLREKFSLTPPSDDKQIAEARTLIEEIQRQHAQIRTRLSGIAMYEDRLRKLEERAEAEKAGTEVVE
ncbi:hypothetical protein [Saccharomonospora viridis]|uniref:Uncharacterized protein n=1 Tax=Saccharomonospora viridis (strain ATCC 15386 / DSM 43017 / JCM 3036 / CCUG 5913 / NBRC 12207 / NCIMB 9602 / P101) TaxID=471857 RepID=C7MSC8_SACVD|nr:hypothetical protein [Saccharomonospora viridis]ACU95241.1 hypothetical protein Svir_01530 [Saccharomonospora viridis DSM 43017]